MSAFSKTIGIALLIALLCVTCPSTSALRLHTKEASDLQTVSKHRLRQKLTSLPQLLNSTDVDQVMLGLELQKFQTRVKDYFQNNKGIDESDKAELQDIGAKLALGMKNAEQGEMGYPFAQTKINDIKKSLQTMKNNVVDQTEEALKINADVKNQNQKALTEVDINSNVFGELTPKIENILAMFPEISKLEKNIELIKNDGQDDELVEVENTFKDQLKKIKEAQGISTSHEQPKNLVQQAIQQSESSTDKMDSQSLISEEDDKLYTNPNQNLSLASLNEVSKQPSPEEEAPPKDQDDDPKPENNLNIQTDEQLREQKLLQNQINEKKKTQWTRDGDYLAFTNYQMNSNQEKFGLDEKTSFENTNLVETDDDPVVVQVE